MFQSTHPHGVRRHLSISCCISEEFQSTHPHGVRLGSMLIFPKCGNVSIHAPTRGATIVSSKKVFDGYVSIHAPTRGATTAFLCAFKCFMFQSTHPHGVRLYRIWFIPIRLCVSIHAPTRGATLTKPLFCKTVSFQSTHPHGVRRGLKEAISCFEEFQSTHPHGVRRDNAFILQGQDEFQSTHPHGVRHSSSKNVGW